ncbi:MAG: hypothetical protein R2827_15050 [Bdellovibrionales bacterium]
MSGSIEVINVKREELNLRDADQVAKLKREVENENLVVVKNYLPLEKINKIKTYLRQVGQSSPQLSTYSRKLP